MSDWLDCIVSYIDLIGISEELDNNTPHAIQKMREMHKIAYDAANNLVPKHKKVYYWNDSVLMLALPDSTHDYEPIMREVNGLKRAIDRIWPTYAISMKGQTIPEILSGTRDHLTTGWIDQQRAVYIQASSLAFSNCFEVEKKLRRAKKSWYLDERIVNHISTEQSRTQNQRDVVHNYHNFRPLEFFVLIAIAMAEVPTSNLLAILATEMPISRLK